MKSIYWNISVLALTVSAVAQQAPAHSSAAPSTETAAPATATTPAATPTPHKADRAASYYHYALGHMYEEQVAMYGRSDLLNKAIDEYRQAIDADPTSEYLTSALAELYTRAGRIRDAVIEAQDILKKDPNNLEAHKLLGRIYLKSMGDVQDNNTSSDNVTKLAIEQYEEIVKLEPDNVDNYLLLGRLYARNNELQKAEAEFKTAVNLDPNSEEAVTTLAYLYNNEGDTTRAAQVLSSIPDAQRSAKLYSVLGYTYEQQKDYKKAIDAYRKATTLDHDNLDAIRGLAENLMNDGQTEAALEQFKIIAEANPEDAETFVRMSEIHRRQGKFDSALDDLSKAESMVQDSVEVAYNKAAIYQAQGRYDDAAQILQGLLKKTEKQDANSYSQSEKSNRALFLERLGTVYRDNNNVSSAVETFRKMLALGDDNTERAYQQIIDTYREAKEWSKATEASKEAVDKLPNDRGLKMVYAGQLADQGQPDQALEQVKSLLKGTPEDREVYVTLAQMYTRLKRWPEADAALDSAAKLSVKDDDKEYVEFLRGSTLERQKKYDEAEQIFRKVLANDPDSAAVLNYLGYMLADRGVKLDEALIMIKKAVELEPANGAYLDSLGWTYFKLGKYEQAEDNLVKASQHMGADPTVQAHLGDLYQKTGRLKLAVVHWDRAIQEWNKTVSAEVDGDELAKVQKDLESAKIRLAKEDPGK